MSVAPAIAGTPVTFQLDSIEKVANPNGGGGDCFRYVISQGPTGSNPITGMRWGSLQEVRSQLDTMVTQMNDRILLTKKKRA